MSRKERLIDRVSMGLELPYETFPGQSLVELIGESRVLVEHHFGICLYTEKEIIIKVSFGQLFIKGHRLRIACMTKQGVIVTGQIDDLSVLRRK